MNDVCPASPRRFSDDSASDAPANSTNAGAQMCVIQRVRNSPAGSGEPGVQPQALSPCRWCASHEAPAWSIVMSTMTSPRSQSIARTRFIRQV